MKKFSLILIILAALLVFGACAPTAGDTVSGTFPRQITVNGTGEVYLEPDIAYITLGVRSESSDAATAVSDNNSLADDIMGALKEMGIKENDIKTSSFNVYWTENWKGDNLPAEKVYVVENMLDVTIRDFTILGTSLDAALGAGANSIYNIRFDVLDKSKAYEEARAMAVENAQNQAAELTAAAGVTLGKLTNISTYDQGSLIDPMYARGLGGGGGMAMESATSVPVSGGQLILQVNVNLVYELED